MTGLVTILLATLDSGLLLVALVYAVSPTAAGSKTNLAQFERRKALCKCLRNTDTDRKSDRSASRAI
jgi:hypothetical protein